ncbi:hypothetical protein B4U80_12398, partial [Leptotrombidium deliense]
NSARESSLERNSRPSENSGNKSPQHSIVTEIGSINGRDSSDLIMMRMRVDNAHLKCLIDTGSMVSIIRKDIAESLDKIILPYSGGKVSSATGHNFDICGETELSVFLNECDETSRVIVYALVVEEFAFEMLLGNDFNRIAGTVLDCSTNRVTFKLNQKGSTTTSMSINVEQNKECAKHTKKNQLLKEMINNVEKLIPLFDVRPNIVNYVLNRTKDKNDPMSNVNVLALSASSKKKIT